MRKMGFVSYPSPRESIMTMIPRSEIKLEARQITSDWRIMDYVIFIITHGVGNVGD